MENLWSFRVPRLRIAKNLEHSHWPAPKWPAPKKFMTIRKLHSCTFQQGSHRRCWNFVWAFQSSAEQSVRFFRLINYSITFNYWATPIWHFQQASVPTVYHPLALGGPAIDAGADVVRSGFSVFQDSRGVSRVLGGGDYRPDHLGRDRPEGRECDIGAVEFVDESFCWVIPLPSGGAVTPCL